MTSDRAEEKKRHRKSREPAVVQPSQQDIAIRAFAIHIQRGAEDGNDLQDWFQAEQELREEQERSRS